ncbi:MAG: PQQ-binding-like beta-propeller repeat protein [Verrucomicrobia bacterium]|nr:PQQ-binding-like beta-propeller repeat protein [Verrucomicrobiota bacterium]
MRSIRFLILLTASIFFAGELSAVTGWLNWRGADQNGKSPAKVSLPDSLDLEGKEHRWTYPVRGGGTPVAADGRLYAFGFYGETEDVEETLLCLDAETGKKIWEHTFADYISDIVYNRYAIGAPVIDAETGNVYVEATNGLVMAFSRDGKLLWEVSMMEEYGRLTFPNGRTGAPAVDGDIVVIHCITANWSTNGPARNRFYGFDKHTGELVWFSTPGVGPLDSSFSTPVFADLGDQRVFYAGTGCGNIVCVNARTGEAVWRFQLATGGVNSSVVLVGDDGLIAVHGKENVDTTAKGRLVRLKIPTEYPEELPLVLGAESEVWRNGEHVAFTSSPTLVGKRVYTTIATGSLLAVDIETGKTVWSEKMAPDQLHASPGYADGKLYVPMLDGVTHILKDRGAAAEIISSNEMGANCLGAPAFYNNRVYVFTKQGLHCFGDKKLKKVNYPEAASQGKPGSIAQIQLVPAEFAVGANDSQTFKVYGLDAAGRRVRDLTSDATFAKWNAPNAPRPSEVDATLSGNKLTRKGQGKLTTGNIQATVNGMTSVSRGRVVAGVGYNEDFESTPLILKDRDGVDVSPPPGTWLGAGPKWHIMEKDGGKIITNRLENLLWQRTMNFIGKSNMKSYTIEADVMTDGTRRVLSTVGVVNQRYLITLSGNQRLLEVSSNHERVKESVPFPVKPNTWYHLKTRVDTNPDGSGVVRAKAWAKGTGEPDAWTIESKQKKVHVRGAPGVFAFSPQSMKRVFIDNISISSNN